MIHFKEENEDRIVFYFTKGISQNDLNILRDKIESMGNFDVETFLKNDKMEYFPTTKSYKNDYMFKNTTLKEND